MRRPSGSRSRVAETVRTLITPTADELGYFLWDVEYVKEGADMILRITIDSDEGISIDDCERMTRAIDPILDEADPIEESYLLEVSSPGIERTLKKKEHFTACVGECVEIRLFSPDKNGKKAYKGVLTAADEAGITVEADGETLTLEYSAVAKANTFFEF